MSGNQFADLLLSMAEDGDLFKGWEAAKIPERQAKRDLMAGVSDLELTRLLWIFVADARDAYRHADLETFEVLMDDAGRYAEELFRRVEELKGELKG